MKEMTEETFVSCYSVKDVSVTDTLAITEACNRWSDVVRRTGEHLSSEIIASANALIAAVQRKGRVLVCGNGGSACDADHLAAELVGRYERERDGISSINLAAGPGMLTAIANDYGYEELFRRQFRAHARSEDILVAISTSGHSPNVLAVLDEAAAAGVESIILTGSSGPAAKLATHALCVPSDRTPDIQQGHRALIHILCDRVEASLLSQKTRKSSHSLKTSQILK